MDTVLARTFLEIVTVGSFQGAAERLNVSQTAISARIRSLESQLGHPLFVRNKSGASLTRAGEGFLRYAPTLVQLWERAKQVAAIPDTHLSSLAIGGELSLWDPVILDWLIWMKVNAPGIALRTQVGSQDRLTSSVADGLLDIAVVYAPKKMPGLKVERLLDEKLVLISTNPDWSPEIATGYVYVDWGPEFASQHDTAYPSLSNAGVQVSLGPLALGYILKSGGAGYFRMSSVRPLLESGRVYRVAGAPEFYHPAFAVYALSSDADSLQPALKGMRDVAAASRR